MKHTELPFVNGWGDGLTGPTTPSTGEVVCGGKKWPYAVISKNKETIAIIPKQKDGIMEENAAFIVKAVNEREGLIKMLKKLEVAANTVNGCYSRNPKNFALALKSLAECAVESREAIKNARDE